MFLVKIKYPVNQMCACNHKKEKQVVETFSEEMVWKHYREGRRRRDGNDSHAEPLKDSVRV